MNASNIGILFLLLLYIAVHVAALKASRQASLTRAHLFDELDRQIEKLQAELDKTLERLNKNDKKLN
jgi:cbb3-type cytochrome oxidase subunit 3